MTKEEKLQTEVITTEQAIYCMNHQYNYEKYECDDCPYCDVCEEKGIEGRMIKRAVIALGIIRDLPSVAPCEDCVSRKSVLKAIKEWWRTKMNADGNPSLCDDILVLPSVAPTQEWIPVSEKIPNDRDWYLGIFKEPDTGWINPLPFICDYVGSETKATTKEYWILHGFTDRDEHIDYYFNLECVAWMPLPKPYEGDKKDD